MAQTMNQFSMAPVAGSKVNGTNVIRCEFYSASASDTISAGQGVIIVATVKPNVTKVSVGAGLTAQWFGVVLTNPMKDTFAVGDKIEVAAFGTVVLMTASAAITAGASVQLDPSTNKVATQTASNTKIGIALESAGADADVIRVMITPVV